MVLFVFLIGFRYQVGGDWGNYLFHFEVILYYTFDEVLSRSDPGYYVINWLIAKQDGSILWVNLICAVIVMRGVSVFARNQPLPWLALTSAVPYLLIVVAMGYTRQAAALGFALMGLAALGQNKTKQFVFWVIIGATFHKSAVLLLPIAAIAATRNKVWTFFWVSITAIAAAHFFVAEEVDRLWINYVEAGYHSQGGLIRVAMNIVPAVILLLYRKRIFYNPAERKLWLWMAILSLSCVPLVLISSTAVDRVALYFIPIQMFAFSRLPYLSRSKSDFEFLSFAVIAYYALVLFVWLNFAIHARYWLPYDNYLLY
jgi:hypothetical protein